MKTPSQWMDERFSVPNPEIEDMIAAIQKEAYDHGWTQGMIKAQTICMVVDGEEVYGMDTAHECEMRIEHEVYKAHHVTHDRDCCSTETKAL